jgi:hypothetical protein
LKKALPLILLTFILLARISFQINVNGVAVTSSLIDSKEIKMTNNPTVNTTRKVVTQTPIETISCLINPVQAICQSPVLIVNVHNTQINPNSNEICWDTNIETKGALRYGEAEKGQYIYSTDVESEYLLSKHCFELNNLTDNTDYIYTITSNSFVGKTKTLSGIFNNGSKAKSPNNKYPKPIECIQVKPNSYSFNSLNQANINFLTKTNTECILKYGNNSNRNTNSSLISVGSLHDIYVDLQQLDGKTDFYYQIECKSTKDKVETICKYNDFIPVSKYNSFIDYSKLENKSADVSNLMIIISVSLIILIVVYFLINILYIKWKKRGK